MATKREASKLFLGVLRFMALLKVQRINGRSNHFNGRAVLRREADNRHVWAIIILTSNVTKETANVRRGAAAFHNIVKVKGRFKGKCVRQVAHNSGTPRPYITPSTLTKLIG